MEIIYKKLEELKPYFNNPRINENAVPKVMESIKEFGFKVPIVIDSNNVIITGHTRYRASQELNLKEVPCIIADDLTPEKIKAFRLADNKVSEFSQWDFNALALEIEELKADDIDMEIFGFVDESIDIDAFGDDFSLPDGDKNPICQMSFTLHEEQKKLIEYAMKVCGECSETFGNPNKKGNQLYEVVKQWAELKK